MSLIIGFIIAFVSVLTALGLLDQSIKLYLDEVAIAIVFGGTCAVSMMILPWGYRREIWDNIAAAFTTKFHREHDLLSTCLHYISGIHEGQIPPLQQRDLAHVVLRDGAELISLRFSEDEIEVILTERIRRAGDASRAIASAWKSLAKYPPAFGLVGTVFGLVHLMRALAQGLSPREIGTLMATALVATLYGLILANLVIAPFAEAILKAAEVRRRRAEVALHAVLLAHNKTSILKSQELLNSFVSQGERVNFVATYIDDDRKAA